MRQNSCTTCQDAKVRCEDNGSRLCKRCTKFLLRCNIEEVSLPPDANILTTILKALSIATTFLWLVLRNLEGLGRKQCLSHTEGFTDAMKFGYYERHFLPDLPFVHKSQFFDGLKSKPETLDNTIFLHAFLALTARFHEKLVKPIETTELYARMTREELKKHKSLPVNQKIIQAQLMLAYHEWMIGACNESFLTGIAQHLCQAGDELEQDEPQDPDDFIRREIALRTSWSYCIVDLFTGMEESNRTTLTEDRLGNAQLPCSSDSFRRGTRLQAAQTADNGIDGELGGEEDGLYHYIRATQVFRDLWQWICNNGEQYVVKHSHSVQKTKT